jgi:tetratricopeptide (TPR) repeat protein
MSAHRWHDVVPVATALAEAAARDGDAVAEGRARYMLGGALTDIGRAAEAVEHVRLALELSARAGDDDVHAMTVNVHAMTMYPGLAAVAEHRRCAALARRLGNTHLEALTLGNLVMARLVEPGIDEGTVRASERQLELYRRSGDRHGEALGRYSNGQVLLRQGRPDAAIAAHLRALELLDEGELEFVRAGAHVRLAEAYTQTGRPDLALDRAGEALALSREIRYARLEALALRAQGDALEALRRPEQARLARQNAVEIFRHIGSEGEAEQVAALLTDEPPMGRREPTGEPPAEHHKPIDEPPAGHRTPTDEPPTGRRRPADGRHEVWPVAEAAE